MTSPEALIKELRESAETLASWPDFYPALMKASTCATKAASELSRLSARVKELEGEVRSFRLLYSDACAEKQAAESRAAAMRDALEAFLHPDGLSSANLPRNLETARTLTKE